MLCPTCGKEELLEHRTGTALEGYCPRCGQEAVIRREIPRERWTDVERVARKLPPKKGRVDNRRRSV